MNIKKKADLQLSIVINYFNPKSDPHVLAVTKLCIESIFKYTSMSFELILTDGSGFRNTELDQYAREKTIQYLPSETPEKYATSFNRGLKAGQGKYLVILANDIFLNEGWDQALTNPFKDTGIWMSVPYLSFSDFSPQVRSFTLSARNCTPRLITFNVNVLPRCVYEVIGPMDEYLSGCFNDIDYLIRIRRNGGAVKMIDCGNLTHLGKGTLSTSSLASYENDKSLFLKKYPELKSRSGDDVNYASQIMCPSRVSRIILKMISYIPSTSFVSKAIGSLHKRIECFL